ncbi:MAG: TraM recognition domain-containing protein [Flavipsychrobacter sp.]
MKYLLHGFGGLILTVKPDEKDTWLDYAKTTGREKDVIVIEPGQNKYVFNFLEYESKLRNGVSYTDNIHEVLRTVIRAAEEKAGGRSDDAFWEQSLDLFMNNVITLCLLAYDKATIQLLFDIAQSAPKRPLTPNVNEYDINEPTAYQKAVTIVKDRMKKAISEWNCQHDAAYIQSLPEDVYESLLEESIHGYRDLKMLNNFFMESFYSIGEKTRAIIEFCLTSFLQRILRDPIYSLLARYSSTVTPEDCLNGKVIILNLPVKQYHKAGQDAQILFKYIWQRAMEQRNVKIYDRPVFLWADEAQHFLHEHDAEFQATARSSRVATVYLTQNLPNFFANMGGEKSTYKVKAFLGTLSTKIFHANSDAETNAYASELIGEAYQHDHSRNVNLGQQFSVSKGTSVKLESMVRKETFSRLKTGGPLNDFICEAYVVIQGKTFSNGFNYRKVGFHQNIHPYTDINS